MKLTEKLSIVTQLQEDLAQCSEYTYKDLSNLNHSAQQITESDRSTIFIYNSESDMLESYVAKGLPSKIYVALGEGIVGRCAEIKELIVENDVDTTKTFQADIDLSSGYVTKNTLVVPILGTNNALLGVIQVLNKNGNYDETDERLLMSLAEIASKCVA